MGFGPSAVTSEIVLDVKDLQTHFATRWGTVKAVDGVNLQRAPWRGRWEWLVSRAQENLLRPLSIMRLGALRLRVTSLAVR